VVGIARAAVERCGAAAECGVLAVSFDWFALRTTSHAIPRFGRPARCPRASGSGATMMPSGRCALNSSASDVYIGTPAFFARSARQGRGPRWPPAAPTSWATSPRCAGARSGLRPPRQSAPCSYLPQWPRSRIRVSPFQSTGLRQLVQAVDGQRVAEHAEADDDASRDRGDVGVVPECLALVHIGDVQLDQRQAGTLDGVVQGN
jgi:hypothetical protein